MQLTRERRVESDKVGKESSWRKYIDALRYRNVRVSIVISVCLMIALWVMNIFAPLFLTNIDHLTETQMGYVVSSMGFGAFVWGFLVPWISDHLGRRTTLILFSFISIFAPLVMYFYHANWITLSIIGFFINVVQGLFPLFMNIIPLESVPEDLAVTSIALTTSIGDIVGAALVPGIVGALADHFGLPIM